MADILIVRTRDDKATISGETEMGKEWVAKNMGTYGEFVITVAREGVADIVDLIEKDGLTILER